MEFLGEVISIEECEHRMTTMYAEHINYYFLSIGASTVLDAGRKGSEARFGNHSCAPVMLITSPLTVECGNREMDRQRRTTNRGVCRKTRN